MQKRWYRVAIPLYNWRLRSSLYILPLLVTGSSIFSTSGKVSFKMGHSLMQLAVRIVEILFFTGLVGCAAVVVVSWVKIFREGFSDSKDARADY